MTKDQLRAKFWRYETWAASCRGREFLMDLYRREVAEDPRPTFRILAVASDREPNCDHRRLATIRDVAQ
jgi:hypothetical protein